ncbi:MAG: hypothetical protein KKC80_01310 [Candidatus Margulisbacteria bacterium]|nr:hypothetical protein [Candidatus Margulisiibacteriota bacterium]MBU1616290.1 hypothetical protein [Candidatus Margulisiibacteriota bacterium]
MQPVPTTTVMAPTALPAPPSFKLLQYPDLGTAFDPIIAQRPRIIAVGEIHKKNYSTLVSTASLFAKEALPKLVQAGYRDFVVEFLPSGPTADHEIRQYLNSGELGPLLSRWLHHHPDYCGFIGFLETARSLQQNGASINIYGSNYPSIADFLANTPEARAEYINTTTQARIMSLYSAGRKVISYTGTQHNNIEPLANEEMRSFGQNIRQIVGLQNYHEVDLYLGPLVANQTAYYLQLSGSSFLVPDRSVNALFFPGRTVMITPLPAAPLLPLSPTTSPTCD